MGFFDDVVNGVVGGAIGGLPGTIMGLGGGGLNGAMDTIYGFIPGVSQGREAQAAYQRQIRELIDRIDKEWKLPNYDKTPLTQEEYTLLNMYAPQVAGFIQQQAPELLKNVSNEGTQAQSQALTQLSDLSKTGNDAGTKAEYEAANMSADQALRSNRANALAALAQRGLGSSGATLNADIGAGLGAAEQQRKAALQSASDASQRRVQAIQGLGNLGSQVASQKQQGEEFNANTLNQYNQLLANRRQQYENYVADIQNQANMYNQQQSQNIANANTGVRNQTNTMNRQRNDAMENAMANAQNDKLRAIAGMQSGAAQQGLQYGQQQSQNMTNMFLGLAGIGGGLLTGGAGGGAMAAGGASRMAPQQNFAPVDYGNMNPNYNLYENSQEGALR
jgi:hypothetical protein